jgi:hypothetical protein
MIKEAKNAIDEIMRKKEYFSLKYDTKRNFRAPVKYDPLDGKHLKVHSYQLFPRNLINPNTDVQRLLIKHGTGSGKTITGISIAMSFVEVFKRIYDTERVKYRGKEGYIELDKKTPSVFIFGFSGTQAAFIRDLLKYPEFGFVSPSEREEYEKLQSQAFSGTQAGRQKFAELHRTLRRRILQKAKGGFFKFYGYKKFVNALFISESLSLTDLEERVDKIERENPENPNNPTLEDIINEEIRAGRVQVNFRLLEQFKDSLIICDEIHNCYNSYTKNNYGVAIQYLLDNIPGVRAVFMSATPMNNAASEIIELLNLLSPATQKVKKSDFFLNNKEDLPGAKEEIGKLFAGKVSFLQDMNPKFFPKVTWSGEVRKFNKEYFGSKEIPYFKLVSCPMSEFQQSTLDDLIKNPDTTYNTYPENIRIQQNSYAIYDIAFPNPESDTVGLYKSNDVYAKIMTADQEWRDKVSIAVQKIANSQVIVGEFMKQDKIEKYSAKYRKVINLIFDSMKPTDEPSDGKKFFIYHDRVKLSGVLLIQELMKVNGFIDEYSEAGPETVCCICGTQNKLHKDRNHEYYPARFAMAHSDIDKSTMEESIARFGQPENANGLRTKFIIGSKVLRETYTIPDVAEHVIMSLPRSIPVLIQVFGRTVRKNSHINLPPEKRRVNFSMLVTSTRDGKIPSPEEFKYFEKGKEYMLVQAYEQIINGSAIDAPANRDIIMPKELLQEYFPTETEFDLREFTPKNKYATPIRRFGNLYFEPITEIPEYNLNELDTITFDAHSHNREEIEIITVIIKRLFLNTSGIYKYGSLWKAVQEPPFGVEVNPRLFNQLNFVIALNNLVRGHIDVETTSTKKLPPSSERLFISRLFNPNEKKLYNPEGRVFKIVQIDEYYVLCPVIDGKIYADINCFSVKQESKFKIQINTGSWETKYRETIEYDALANSFKERFSPDNADLRDIFHEFNVETQIKILKTLIESIVLGKAGKFEKKVTTFYSKFGITISAREMSKYRDITKRFKSKKVIGDNGQLLVPGDTVVGFAGPNGIFLCDGTTWIEIAKVAMNRQLNYRENNILIGYFDERCRFKIRKPVQQLLSDPSKLDSRLIEKGIVCSTKPKPDLVAWSTMLGLKQTSKVKNVCKEICNELLRREEIERQKDSRVKYMYLLDAPLPSLSLASNRGLNPEGVERPE